MSDQDRRIVDWLETQSAGRGWNVAPKSDGWPLTVVTRGPFATFRQAVLRAMDIEADAKAERDDRHTLEQQRANDYEVSQ